MTAQEKLLADIERFLLKQGMDHTRFGIEALNDPSFVTDLRGGRRVRIDTADRVREFMESRKAAKPNPKRAADRAAA
jgi:hypothetical protein